MQKKSPKTIEAEIPKEEREFSREAPPLQGGSRSEGNWWAALAGTPGMGLLSPADMVEKRAPERRVVTRL